MRILRFFAVAAATMLAMSTGRAYAQEISKSDSLSAAISSVKGEELWNLSYNDPVRALTGKMAGVLVLNTSGEPGAMPGLKIRGFSSFIRDTEPLFIVDGLRVKDVQYLAPEMIESIEVLKGAAVALYGAEAGEGAVIIHTRKGEGGKGHVFYRNEFSLASLAHKSRMMDASQYIDFAREYGLGQYVKDVNSGVDTDWLGAVTEPSWNFRHTFGVQGGNDRGAYFVSANIIGDDGIFAGDKDRYNRMSAQVNGSYQLTPWLRLSTSNSLEKHKGSTIMTGTYDTQSPFISAMVAPPIRPVTVDKDGLTSNQIQYLGGDGRELAKDSGSGLYLADLFVSKTGHPFLRRDYWSRSYDGYSLRGMSSAVFTPLSGLEISAKLGYFRNRSTSLMEVTPFYYDIFNYADYRDTENTDDEYSGYQGDLTVSYNRDLGKHRIEAMAGGEYISAVINSLERGNQSDRKYRYFGHLGYVFSGRYAVSAGFSRGTQMIEVPNMSYSVSASAGPFEFLSLRASYGRSQNEFSDFSKAFPETSPSQSMLTDRNFMDAGIDVRLLDEKVSVSLDFFHNNSQQAFRTKNIGLQGDPWIDMAFTNSGAELSLSASDRIGEVSWSVSGNVSYLRNRTSFLDPVMTRLTGSYNTGITDFNVRTVIEQGYPMWSFRGYKAVGVDPQTGKGIYAEVVEDGEYNYDDEQEIGSGIPSLSYGISISLAYRGFDLAVTGSGVAGNQIYSCLWSTAIPMQNTYAKLWESTWQAPGDNAAYPSVNNWSTFVNKSSFNLWNGSFFKLRQIQLGYSLPESLLRKVWTKQIRIYASLDNFVCLTNYPGLDPETVITSDPSIGVEMGAFPDPKQISFGINLAF